MHGPFSKILGARAAPATRIDAPEEEYVWDWLDVKR